MLPTANLSESWQRVPVERTKFSVVTDGPAIIKLSKSNLIWQISTWREKRIQITAVITLVYFYSFTIKVFYYHLIWMESKSYIYTGVHFIDGVGDTLCSRCGCNRWELRISQSSSVFRYSWSNSSSIEEHATDSESENWWYIVNRKADYRYLI